MAFIIVLVFLLIVGKSLLVPLFMGGFFAILFTPLSNWLETHKLPMAFSSVISLLLMICIALGFISFLIGNVVSFTNDFNNVSERLSAIIQGVDSWMVNTFGIQGNLTAQLDFNKVLAYLKENAGSISAFAMNIIGSLSGIILIPIFMFFFLLYRDHLTQMMIKVYRDKDPETIKMRISSLRKVIQNYLAGVAKVMVILAILNVSAYALIGVKHAVFFGLIGALLNIIPYIGPFIGVLLPIVYSILTMESLIYPVLILGSYQLIQLIEGNFLTPKIVGGNVNLNAFITFLGLFIGGSIWGVAGMILMIPTLAILREIFDLSESTKPFAHLFVE